MGKSGKRRTYRNHKQVFEQANGPVPDGYLVHHKCLNKGCTNPEHLVLMKQGEHTKFHNLYRGADDPASCAHASITLVSKKDLAGYFGCSTWALDEWQRNGVLPRPTVRLAPNIYRWRLSDIEAWLNKLARSPYVPPAARGKVALQAQPRPPTRRVRF